MPSNLPKVGFVVQTNYAYKAITNYCALTWNDVARDKGYSVIYEDFSRNPDLSFFELLLKVAIENTLELVVVNFDDLYFKRFTPPEALDVISFFKDSDVMVLRLDARPPGYGEIFGKLNQKISLRHAGDGHHANSLVLSCFCIDALKILVANGVCDPWEYEQGAYEKLKTVVVDKRTSKYANVIVKGKVDVIALFAVKGVCLGIWSSIWRYLRRYEVVSKIVRCIRSILIRAKAYRA